LFANNALDSSGYGEGQFFIGAITNVTTDTNGNASFSTVSTTPAGQYITATATDPAGNTSEFSQAVQVIATLPQVDLSITNTDSPDPVTVNNQLTYTLNVQNNPPSPPAVLALQHSERAECSCY
jgi:hypothetical protein